MSATLNNRIRVFRAEYRLSQTGLAERIGVTRKTISTIEVGRFVHSTVIALKIARCFGVPLDDIFSLPDDHAASLPASPSPHQGD
jgi:putative transcriptional regulator